LPAKLLISDGLKDSVSNFILGMLFECRHVISLVINDHCASLTRD
jgi:hypothetical protein